MLYWIRSTKVCVCVCVFVCVCWGGGYGICVCSCLAACALAYIVCVTILTPSLVPSLLLKLFTRGVETQLCASLNVVSLECCRRENSRLRDKERINQPYPPHLPHVSGVFWPVVLMCCSKIKCIIRLIWFRYMFCHATMWMKVMVLSIFLMYTGLSEWTLDHFSSSKL